MAHPFNHTIMIIQFNTGNQVTRSEEMRESLSASISEQMSHFSDQITRLEVHLSDENGHKPGLNDKRCMLEARIESMQPIAVTNHADTFEQALDGAVEKMKTSLTTVFGRLSRR